MRKKIIADNVIKLLKKGYSPKEITQRVAVSYNYAWKLKKDLDARTKEVADEVIIKAAEALKEACTFTPKAEPEVKAKEEEGLDTVLDKREDQYG